MELAPPSEAVEKTTDTLKWALDKFVPKKWIEQKKIPREPARIDAGPAELNRRLIFRQVVTWWQTLGQRTAAASFQPLPQEPGGDDWCQCLRGQRQRWGWSIGKAR